MKERRELGDRERVAVRRDDELSVDLEQLVHFHGR